ncbi:unnamed protein product [Bathycoccus prasinos]
MHSMQRIDATVCTGSRLSTHFSSGKTASISNRKIVVNSVVNNAQNHQHVSRINKRHEETSRFQLKRETQDLSIVEWIGSERRGALLRTRAANIPDSFDPSKYDGTGAAEGEDEGKPATLMETLFGGDGWNKGRTRPPAKDRLLAILPYLIPMMGCIAFTNDGFEFFPLTLQFLDFFTAPMMIFYSNGFIPFCTFFGLFLAVVRNPKVPHFIRYNTMQAIMLDICIMLAGLIMQYLPLFLAVTFFGALVEILAFANGTYAILYSVWNAVQGLYPEIPIITEAVYAQVTESIQNPDDFGEDED